MHLPDFLMQGDCGEIRLTGHRIDLMHVVDYHNAGHSPEQIHQEYPTLPLKLINEALDFYRANRAEVDAYVARCHEEIARQYANYRPSPGQLRIQRLLEKLQRADAERAGDATWSALPILEKVRFLEAQGPPENA